MTETETLTGLAAAVQPAGLQCQAGGGRLTRANAAGLTNTQINPMQAAYRFQQSESSLCFSTKRLNGSSYQPAWQLASLAGVISIAMPCFVLAVMFPV